MSDLVRVRSASGRGGVFVIGRGLFEKHRDSYVLADVPVKRPKPMPKPFYAPVESSSE